MIGGPVNIPLTILIDLAVAKQSAVKGSIKKKRRRRKAKLIRPCSP